ncbi:prepilin-type cleavage/methylation domain-containing protein [Vibrio rotiferianus]|uniref:MSHA biogenesis protein MshO n=1 Tax=Vibrio rotiferianus TaxID=190895 RepID=A0A510I8M4_9VIBR|nr:prepilin-type N-terminal cleavage/methylation domain-containing protein [Vibrio rotiferianus]TMX36488.1 prepilin-type cleavage/methylation domain-containing protein [Vibrio rotiferianus]TMX47242.1 prepilin-type cleavage/methylation domain-containing protein [Vibrio rotiferianus]TMX62940.1 prepilin-type cleavage/methylation domain-containing protein [Vibrio rotiferianus]BBL90039.1 MSHA biogenesis protein MshO [Vibrio rotiferianus]
MKEKGFTLLELIITIVVGSIIMLGIAGYVQMGMKGFVDSTSRQQVQTQAQFVLEKLSREIRHAVPYSFKVEGDCLRFVPILYSGTYYQPSVKVVRFVTGETVPNGGTLNASDNLRFVINPSRYEDLTSNTESFAITPSLPLLGQAASAPADRNYYEYTLPAGVSHLPSQSIANRLYIYTLGAEVNYCLNSTTNMLTRNGVPVESIVAADSAFNYENTSLQVGGIVYLKFAFEQNDEVSVYQHDVQVLNVP